MTNYCICLLKYISFKIRSIAIIQHSPLKQMPEKIVSNSCLNQTNKNYNNQKQSFETTILKKNACHNRLKLPSDPNKNKITTNMKNRIINLQTKLANLCIGDPLTRSHSSFVSNLKLSSRALISSTQIAMLPSFPLHHYRKGW